jgi:hypothetical protein
MERSLRRPILKRSLIIRPGIKVRYELQKSIFSDFINFRGTFSFYAEIDQEKIIFRFQKKFPLSLKLEIYFENFKLNDRQFQKLGPTLDEGC